MVKQTYEETTPKIQQKTSKQIFHPLSQKYNHVLSKFSTQNHIQQSLQSTQNNCIKNKNNYFLPQNHSKFSKNFLQSNQKIQQNQSINSKQSVFNLKSHIPQVSQFHNLNDIFDNQQPLDTYFPTSHRTSISSCFLPEFEKTQRELNINPINTDQSENNEIYFINKKNLIYMEEEEENTQKLYDSKQDLKKQLIQQEQQQCIDETTQPYAQNMIQQKQYPFETISQTTLLSRSLEKSQNSYIRLLPNKIEINLAQQRRIILTDWLMELGFDHNLTRDTVHQAIFLMDSYFQAQKTTCDKTQLQLIAVSCLFIACKKEEVVGPTISDFVESTAGAFNSQQIRKMESNIIKVLKWKLNPVTYNTWLNFCLYEWDKFIKNMQPKDQILLFKEVYDKKAYERFQEISNMIDASILDISTYSYTPKVLILSFMYIFIGLYMNFFSQQIVVQHFYNSSHYIYDQTNDFNSLFQQFLKQFEIELSDLLPSIQYASTFFKISIYPDYVNEKLNPSFEKKKNFWGQLTQIMLYNETNMEYIKFRQQNYNL